MVADPSKAQLDSSKAHLELLEALGQAVPRTLDIPRGAADLRQPQPAHGRDRADRVRHGLHARALPPAQPRAALDPAARSTSSSPKRGYPEEIRALDYDPRVGDARPGGRPPLGNIFKMDRHGHVGRVYHGRASSCRATSATRSIASSASACRRRATSGSTRCSRCPRRSCTRRSSTGPSSRRGAAVATSKLWQDIRECIDEAHRDDTMKRDHQGQPRRLHRHGSRAARRRCTSSARRERSCSC